MIINYSVANYMLAFRKMPLDAEDYVLTLTSEWKTSISSEFYYLRLNHVSFPWTGKDFAIRHHFATQCVTKHKSIRCSSWRRRQKLTPQQRLVNNLDLIGFIAHYIWSQRTFSPVSAWILGWFMCKTDLVNLAEIRKQNIKFYLFFFHFEGKTVPYIQGVSVAASVYSLIAVSLDR